MHLYLYFLSKGIQILVGRGVYRSYYKGHMGKIKGKVEAREGGGFGWGGVEGWGENEDNYN